MAKEILNLEVKSNIESVVKETDDLGVSLGKSVDETKDLGSGLEDAGAKGKKGFALVTGGVKAFGLALKAAGIGLVIAILASLKEALERNQTVMNAVNTIMTTLSTTFNQVVEVLTEVYTWVTDSSERFDGLTKVIGGLMTLALTPLKLAFYSIKLAIEGALLAWEDSFLGGGDEARIIALSESIRGTADDIKAVGKAAIEAGGDIVNNIGDAIGEVTDIGKMAIKGISDISIKANIEMAKATTAAANASKLAEAQIQGLIEKYDRQAELQRQIRDDERKTFAERITANAEIAKILKKQEKEMLALANTRVASAKLERDANVGNIDLEVAYQATLNDRAGVLAQITGFASEQKTNEATLEKELGEVKKELAQDSIDGMERELLELKNAYELKLDMARKAGEDTKALTEQYELDQAAIREAHLEPLLALQQQNTLALIENLKERALAELKIQEDKEIASAESLEHSEEIKEQIRIKYARLRGAVAKGTAQNEIAWENMTQEEKLNKVKDTAGQMAKIFGEESAAGKAFAITQATIDTFQGANAAYSSMAKIPYVGPVLGGIAAAAAIASGLANVKAIASASSSGGGGGGGSAPSTSAAPPAPQMMSGAFELSGGQEVEPVQAYVVSDNITDSQNGLAIIRRRATI